MKNKKGFTLVELLVVIAIISILSAIAVVNLNMSRQKAKIAAARAYGVSLLPGITLCHSKEDQKVKRNNVDPCPVTFQLVTEGQKLCDDPNIIWSSYPEGVTVVLCRYIDEVLHYTMIMDDGSFISCTSATGCPE